MDEANSTKVLDSFSETQLIVVVVFSHRSMKMKLVVKKLKRFVFIYLLNSTDILSTVWCTIK